MSTYRLDKLFAPGSVAVVGASPRDGSLGRSLLKNLRDGGFAGPKAFRVSRASRISRRLPTWWSSRCRPTACLVFSKPRAREAPRQRWS